MTAAALFATVVFCAAPCDASASHSPGELSAEDIFGRRLNSHGLILVDWEGYMANPAIKFFVVPPEEALFPAKAVLTADEPRLYFDLPSEVGAHGPRKEVRFERAAKVPVYVSIFPSRQKRDETHVLHVDFCDAGGRRVLLNVPLRALGHDRPESRHFQVTVDFSQDRSRFFENQEKRDVIVRAANDWADFLDGMALDAVPAGKEKTFIWNPDGFQDGKYIVNSKDYRGYLLYAYGIAGAGLRSGGEGSRAGGFQSRNGKTLPLRRSGGLEMEVRGNYNQRGWLVHLPDRDWWKATNLNGVENDLYSIAHHEIGHALFFNEANPLFGKAKKQGQLGDPAVSAYLGFEPAIDRSDHFKGTIDPASLRGAFGNEYHGKVPRGRWLITKTDLLFAQALGYKLRETSAFVPLRLVTAKLPAGKVSVPYAQSLRAEGGVPFYDWEIIGGALPDGLTLNAFTGEISGTPRKHGRFQFVVRLRDYDERSRGTERTLDLDIVGQ